MTDIRFSEGEIIAQVENCWIQTGQKYLIER